TQIIRKQAQKQSRPIIQLDYYVKVGNAFMQVPEYVVRTLSQHVVNRGRFPPRVVTRRYLIKLACCALSMEETRYKELNSAFMKQFSDVFSKKLPSRLPPEGGPKHCIIVKDDEPINGRLMRVLTRFWPAMQRFIDTNLKAGRLRRSSSNISAGKFKV